MWLINSSIGRKVIMSITGACLVLFLLFHGLMNLVVVFSPESYNAICEFLGANWYALIASVGLGLMVVIHILYAFYLSLLNYRARGHERYAVTEKQNNVEWASKNMLVLGIIIFGFLALHLYNFWYKMQFAEIIGQQTGNFNPTDGAAYVKELFSQPVYCLFYLIWLGALWFHLTHGVWSSFHTLGWNNNTWMPRVKCISNIIATLVVLLFASVVIYYGISSLCCNIACPA